MFRFSKQELVLANHQLVNEETGATSSLNVFTRAMIFGQRIENAALFGFFEPGLVGFSPRHYQSPPLYRYQQMTPDMAKDKCKNFLETLLRVASDRHDLPDSVSRNVRALIQGLIDGRVEPEVFATELQNKFDSSPQPCLVPFLKKTLPHLQQSLATRELSIEGVLPPTVNACQTFQDMLYKSKTVEMNKEIEEKTSTFKKLEKEKVGLIKKISELEKSQYTNTTEYEDRKGQSQKETKIMSEEIEKIKIALHKCQNDLAKIEKRRDNEIRRQRLDSQKTNDKNNKIKQEIGSLKRKKISIEKEQDDLPKKQKVNEDLVKHISKTIDAKMKDLECPVCFYTAKGDIYQCTGGHLICKECLPSLKLCPECRTEYPKSPFRNRFAEKIDEEIKTLSKERKELLDGI